MYIDDVEKATPADYTYTEGTHTLDLTAAATTGEVYKMKRETTFNDLSHTTTKWWQKIASGSETQFPVEV